MYAPGLFALQVLTQDGVILEPCQFLAQISSELVENLRHLLFKSFPLKGWLHPHLPDDLSVPVDVFVGIR